jgi:hypothetical protein
MAAFPPFFLNIPQSAAAKKRCGTRFVKKLPHDRKRMNNAGELEGAGGPPQIGSNAPKALLCKD